MRTVIGNYSCWVKLLDADIYTELVSDDSLEFLVTLTTKFGIQNLLIMFAKSKPCDI